ncbi:basic proline-rich protein-like [Ochotona curzoniae]|uniref:basic proline-rich protein-like n=1 Tax=Ochotona curzoniae TaxID=130825 RepID=UPI001B34CB09|nr:basic proline-rich protein-like [Ochotona curzoniae]
MVSKKERNWIVNECRCMQARAHTHIYKRSKPKHFSNFSENTSTFSSPNRQLRHSYAKLLCRKTKAQLSGNRGAIGKGGNAAAGPGRLSENPSSIPSGPLPSPHMQAPPREEPAGDSGARSEGPPGRPRGSTPAPGPPRGSTPAPGPPRGSTPAAQQPTPASSPTPAPSPPTPRVHPAHPEGPPGPPAPRQPTPASSPTPAPLWRSSPAHPGPGRPHRASSPTPAPPGRAAQALEGPASPHLRLMVSRRRATRARSPTVSLGVPRRPGRASLTAIQTPPCARPAGIAPLGASRRSAHAGSAPLAGHGAQA